MNAVFNFKVSINEDDILINIDVEKTKDIDIIFLQQTLKVLTDASKKIKANAEKYVPNLREDVIQGNETVDNDCSETSEATCENEDNGDGADDNYQHNGFGGQE